MYYNMFTFMIKVKNRKVEFCVRMSQNIKLCAILIERIKFIGGKCMGLFSKKKKIDYNELFKNKYKLVNQLSTQAHNELDYVIKESLWQNVVDTYQELIDYIDKGAQYDKEHFTSLLTNAKKELEMVHKINEDNV